MSLKIFYERPDLPETQDKMRLITDSQAVLHLESIAGWIAIFVGTTEVEMQYFVVRGENCNYVFFNTFFPMFEISPDDAWTSAFFMYADEFVWNYKGEWGTETEKTAVWILSTIAAKLIPHLKRIEGKLDLLRARLEHIARIWEGGGGVS